MQRYCTTTKQRSIAEDDGRSLLAVDLYRFDRQEFNQLDTLEERRLADMARQGNEDAKQALIASCLGYVYGVACHFAASHPGNIDPMDLAQAGNEEMVRQFSSALNSRYVCAYLKVAAKHAISDAWIEDRLIRVPASSYSRGRRAPLTVSLLAPLSPRSDQTLLDVLECADWQQLEALEVAYV